MAFTCHHVSGWGGRHPEALTHRELISGSVAPQQLGSVLMSMVQTRMWASLVWAATRGHVDV